MKKFFKNNGQIAIGGLAAIGIIGSLVIAALGISWNAFNKSDKALEEVSAMKADVATIKNDVSWIKSIIQENRQNNKPTLKVASSTKN